MERVGQQVDGEEEPNDEASHKEPNAQSLGEVISPSWLVSEVEMDAPGDES